MKTTLHVQNELTPLKDTLILLKDEDESPFIILEALKGIHLVEPDNETLYGIKHRILHECESIRFRRKKDNLKRRKEQ